MWRKVRAQSQKVEVPSGLGYELLEAACQQEQPYFEVLITPVISLLITYLEDLGDLGDLGGL